jgi:hypothetical protein
VDAGSTLGGNPDGGAWLADPAVTGRVLRVCPTGCAYALPSAALAASQNGDTIEIGPGDYVDCGTIAHDDIIVRGLSAPDGGKPRVHSKVCGRKGIFIVQGGSVLIENLELYDAVDPTTNDMNWACIRFDSIATARNLIVRDSYLHDADDGLLGNNISTAPNTLLVENCVFERLGRAGYAHGLYVGTAVDLFVLRNSTVRSNHDDGHLVKSRAKHAVLECDTIAGLQGNNSYEIDLPQGGDALVQHSVVQAGPNLSNTGNTMITFAEENGNNAPHRLVLVDDVLIDDFTSAGKVTVAVAADTSGWAGDRYVGPGAAPTITGAPTGAAAFTGSATRAAAGLPAYDGTMASLPVAPRCR